MPEAIIYALEAIHVDGEDGDKKRTTFPVSPLEVCSTSGRADVSEDEIELPSIADSRERIFHNEGLQLFYFPKKSERGDGEDEEKKSLND